jgi:hypothetical protein
MDPRETVMVSSSNFGGNTFTVLRLVKRSITSASAMTEQASNGQMGQPAATMMENKKILRPVDCKCAAIIH